MAEQEKNTTEEEIKDFCQETSRQKAKKIADFLEKVALDDTCCDSRIVRVVDPKTKNVTYKTIKDPVAMNVRVTAAKTWKEMIMDKSIGDVKEKAKATREKSFNMKAALEAIAKSKRDNKESDAPEITEL